MELRLQQMGDFYEKPHFTMENFYILGACKVGVENYWTKVPKGTTLRQIWSKNRLAYVAVALIWRYTTARKKVRENRHWKVDVVYNTTAATAPSQVA